MENSHIALAKVQGTKNPVSVVEDTDKASSMLSPTRLTIINLLKHPDSASGIAKKLQMPRQKVNYHLKELEKNGFIQLIEEKRRGNCIEKIMQSTASSYVISPLALGALAVDPSDIKDKFSSAYQIAVAARTIKDLAVLREKADKNKRKLPTFSLSSEISFSSPAKLNEFSQELSQKVAELIQKYHDESEGSRKFKFNIGVYPSTK